MAVKALKEDLPTGHPRPWRKCGCGFYFQSTLNGFRVKNKLSKGSISAEASSIPEAIGKLRDMIRSEHDRQFSWK